MARNVPTELILLEIAEGLQSLAKNPDLSQRIKDAYALSEGEKSQAEEARAIIAKSKEFLDDLEKQKSQYADIEERIKQAERIEQVNNLSAKFLAKEKSEAERLIAKNSEKLQEISNANSALKLREDAVIEKELANKETENRLKEFEAKLLGTANILSNTVQGLSA